MGVGQNLELVLADLMLGPDGNLGSRVDPLGAFGAFRCRGGMGAWVQGAHREPGATEVAWALTPALAGLSQRPGSTQTSAGSRLRRADSGVQVEWVSAFSFLP